MKILTILLSWNRPDLLTRTVESYFENTSSPFEFMIVDNGSDKETLKTLGDLSGKYKMNVLKLEKNIGGLAFNKALGGIELNPYDYIHFSENDIEYLPAWDQILLKKLDIFSDIGQISPFSPFPQTSQGEFSWEKAATKVSKNKETIYMAKHNVGTTSIIRSNLIKDGLRWTNLERSNGIRFPHDGRFSRHVKRLGWKVAFNDRYVVKNWGHTIEELQRDLDYYIKNHQAKSFHRFEQRLDDFGYIIQKNSSGNFTLKKK
ncbi:glycosyltransferase involved in cell wall biosynthesis [Evansella vedderi]|uniref:Glycosyltransferase involved in cell wall biosynthesis n=1 Tax=Evansella vedderi TaxID=38282 RepID=A0ABT9ZWN0_9BACI|nr:glycosyltransferase [Evansella vedderi]MDQ0255365.1 glycosyltransferase involved in cell wall biosynthesis [Evansella vedderi]